MSSSSSTSMNRYWIPSWGIHKKVITQELPYYLGPQATVRLYTYEGEDGYLITTLGNCLSDEQIDDLCRKSVDYWDRKEAARSQQDPERGLKRPAHQPVPISGTSGTPRKKRPLER
ncbi:uncharacterized protein F5Z01DRAFT_290207 [Emericellopsis atlantica]|uniref:Uncharacterized protein n=1 Tax=Emericellopsis atlantica TaxID=2614577 RepID=A0A9P7ZGH3_9HYPO|nr:uncharacterized protein F5Z01DRAFT_290207 [Emericellopsis atlantica]KAG9251286.1 hypothetical protein F5Z01DRAFT_290207 [Emericellopsis atlantica]